MPWKIRQYNDEDEDTSMYSDPSREYVLKGNSPVATDGIVGNSQYFNGTGSDALSFVIDDGNDEFYNFSDEWDPGKASSFSIEYWMKTEIDTNAYDYNMVVVGRRELEKNSSYWMGINQSGNVQAYFSDHMGVENTLSDIMILTRHPHG